MVSLSPALLTQGALPPDNSLRIGIAREDDNGDAYVEVNGVRVACGFLQGTDLVIGEPCALIRTEATWLCLGTVDPQPLNVVPLLVSQQQGSHSDSSGIYVNIDGAGSFIKRLARTRLLLTLTATFATSLGTTGADFGLLLNGTTAVTVASIRAGLTAIIHVTVAGNASVSGIPAGTVTVQPQFRSVGGLGIISVSAADRLSYTVQEVF